MAMRPQAVDEQLEEKANRITELEATVKERDGRIPELEGRLERRGKKRKKKNKDAAEEGPKEMQEADPDEPRRETGAEGGPKEDSGSD